MRHDSLVFCFLCWITLISVGSASAQLFPEDTAVPLISRGNLEGFTKSLDENVRSLIDSFYSDYEENLSRTWSEYEQQYQECSQKLNEYLKTHPDETSIEAQAGNDFGFHNLLQTRRRYSERRLEEFAAEVKLLFAPNSDSLKEWNNFITREWRSRILRMIDPSGMELGITNFLLLLEEFELSDEENIALSTTIEVYGNSLDMILKKYEQEYKGLDDQLQSIRRKLAEGNNRAIEEHKKIIDKYQSFNRNVYELNRQYISKFASALSPMNRQVWKSRIERVFIEIMNVDSPIDRIIEILGEVNVLDDDKMNSIELVYDNYISKQKLLRKQFGETLRDWRGSEEWKAAYQEWENRVKRAENGDRNVEPDIAFADNPLLPILMDLLELEKQTTQRFTQLLKFESNESLPIEARWLLSWDKRMTQDN